MIEYGSMSIDRKQAVIHLDVKQQGQMKKKPASIYK